MAITLYVIGGIIVVLSPIIVLTYKLTRASIQTKKASEQKAAMFEMEYMAKHAQSQTEDKSEAQQ